MRKRKPKQRILVPDPRYKDTMVTSFVNNLMWQGKKGVSLKLFYDAMDLIQERSGQDPHETWKRALENATPAVEVRSRRIGGATFQIPTEIHPKRKTSIGMKWLIRFARERSGKGLADKLANELIAAAKGEGSAVRRKEDTHRMAEANRAFAHFRMR
jgi:small subunit ribosomal protein S7